MNGRNWIFLKFSGGYEAKYLFQTVPLKLHIYTKPNCSQHITLLPGLNMNAKLNH